jgi:hypothetical protein
VNERVTVNAYGQIQSNWVLEINSRIITGLNLDLDFGKAALNNIEKIALKYDE